MRGSSSDANVGHRRFSVEARRHDDTVGLEATLAALHHVPVAVLPEAIHRHSGAHGQIESRRVRLEVVGRLARSRVRPAGRGKRPTRQAVVARRSEQAERVPGAGPPGAADPLVRVEDHERPAALLQVVADRKAGLAAADDDRVECLDALNCIASVVRRCCFLCRHDSSFAVE